MDGKALTVTVQTHYGVERVYPACDVSRLLVSIQGGKTLTPDTIAKLKAAGYTLNVAAKAQI